MTDERIKAVFEEYGQLVTGKEYALIRAIAEAVAAQQEPVGSVVRWLDGSLVHGWFGDPPPEGTLLYIHPPPRTEEKNT